MLNAAQDNSPVGVVQVLDRVIVSYGIPINFFDRVVFVFILLICYGCKNKIDFRERLKSRLAKSFLLILYCSRFSI